MNLARVFPSLLKFPKIAQDYDKFTEKLNKPKSITHQHSMANLCYIYRLAKISCDDLYNDQVYNLVTYFQNKYDLEYQNYKKSSKLLLKEKKENSFKIIRITPLALQERDAPFLRKTLYFRELKDMEKYIKVKQLNGAPPFMKLMRQKQLQDNLLDPDNPFGFPLKSPTLFIQLNYKTLYFMLKVFLGEVKFHLLGSFSSQETVNLQKPDLLIDPLTVDEKLQQKLFDFLKEKFNINDQQIVMLNKMGLILGNIKKIQLYMNTFQFLYQEHKD